MPLPFAFLASLLAGVLAKLAEWGFGAWRAHQDNMRRLRGEWQRAWHPHVEVPEARVPAPQDSPLYVHAVHPHIPHHTHRVLAKEQAEGSFSERLAVLMTKATSTMTCVYLFASIGIGSLVGVITGNVLLAAICGSLSSYFLQLVFLPIIQKGSAVMSRHSEMQAEEMFNFSQKTFADMVQVMNHLSAQDSSQIELMELNRQQMALLTRLVATLVDGNPTRLPKPSSRASAPK